MVIVAWLFWMVVASHAEGVGMTAGLFAHEEGRLPNGLRVVTIPWDTPGVVSYLTVMRVDPWDRQSSESIGIAAVHATTLDSPRVAEKSASGNASLRSAATTRWTTVGDDATFYGIIVASDSLDAVVKQEAARFRQAASDEAAYRTGAEQSLGRLELKFRDPEFVSETKLRELTYPRHPYRFTADGTVASLRSLPERGQSTRRALERWYRPENCTIVVVGDVDHARLMKQVEEQFGSWSRGVPPPVPSESTDEPTARIETVRMAGSFEPIIRMGYPIPSQTLAHTDGPALAALAEAICGATSPLHQALVVDEQKVAELHAEVRWTRGPGRMVVTARVRKPADVDDVRSRIQSAFLTAARESMSRSRFLAVTERIRYRFLTHLDRVDDVARMAGLSLAVTGRPDAWSGFLRAIEKLAPHDLQRVAQAYFTRSKPAVVLLLPEAMPR